MRRLAGPWQPSGTTYLDKIVLKRNQNFPKRNRNKSEYTFHSFPMESSPKAGASLQAL
jgi:hypothetical protein